MSLSIRNRLAKIEDHLATRPVTIDFGANPDDPPALKLTPEQYKRLMGAVDSDDWADYGRDSSSKQ